MEIVTAQNIDLDGINSIRAAVSMDPSSGHTLAQIDHFEIEDNEERTTLVCRTGLCAAGYLTLYATHLFGSEKDMMLEIFVHPMYQGNGIGSKLLSSSIDYVRASDLYSRLVLGVMRNNERGIKLYEKNGFNTFREDKTGLYMFLEIAD